jgi:hypothetical protein
MECVLGAVHSSSKFRAAQDTHLAGLERRLFARLTERETRQLAALTDKLLGDREDSAQFRAHEVAVSERVIAAVKDPVGE